MCVLVMLLIVKLVGVGSGKGRQMSVELMGEVWTAFVWECFSMKPHTLRSLGCRVATHCSTLR